MMMMMMIMMTIKMMMMMKMVMKASIMMMVVVPDLVLTNNITIISKLSKVIKTHDITGSSISISSIRNNSSNSTLARLVFHRG